MKKNELKIHPNEPSFSDLISIYQELKSTKKTDNKKLYAIESQIKRHKKIKQIEN